MQVMEFRLTKICIRLLTILITTTSFMLALIITENISAVSFCWCIFWCVHTTTKVLVGRACIIKYHTICTVLSYTTTASTQYDGL